MTRAERARADLLAMYLGHLRSALEWRGKGYCRHRRTGRHLDGWYSEVRKARNAIKHIRALRPAADDWRERALRAEKERDAVAAQAEEWAAMCGREQRQRAAREAERDEARQALRDLLDAHQSSSDAVRLDEHGKAMARVEGWGM